MSDLVKKSGFTLLEVLIALGIIGSALVMLAVAWSGSFARLDKTQMSFEVASLLDQKMGELNRLYRGKPLSEIKEEEDGDFGDNFPQYSWRLKSKLLEPPDIASLLAATNDQLPSEVLSAFRSFRELLGKAVKEVEVTVIFKHPKRNLEFSATTYFIDYEQEFSLGLPN